jgi:hypothetical protein
MISTSSFPRLILHYHRVTSPATATYNCFAWAVGDTDNWWQPGLHWPFVTHPFDDTVEELKRVFRTLGYEECPAANLESGFEKVALFGVADQYTHAARQLSDGKWTSKLGAEEDIEHESPDAVGGGIYGEVVLYMKRKQANSI